MQLADLPLPIPELPIPPEAGNPHSEKVSASSLPLGWRPLNIERYDLQPPGECSTGGGPMHLILVNLAAGRVHRESNGEAADNEIRPGDVAIYPGNLPVRWAWDTRLSFITLGLEAGYLNRIAREVFDTDPAQVELSIVEGQRDPAITGVAGNLMRELMIGDAGSRLYAESTASLLAVHLLRRYARPSKPIEADKIMMAPRAVTQAVSFIHENYSRTVKLEDIAAAANLSLYHLTRVFKKAIGTTPHRYLVQVRVNSARLLLAAGARSLAEVAVAVGFADQSHFTREFKRMLGVTPGQLQQ
jgi:AraC family transcriptional regulator